MRLVVLALAVASGVGSVADAADKLAIGPPADWVRPVAIPDGTEKPSAAAVKLLLQDDQFNLQPGKRTHYYETAYRIQTPQGLPAGAVSLSWNPDIQTITVHKVQIRRGGQVIDVLANGQSFTVMRRENNLEKAVLDGVLTAAIEPEGLQVGDVVDIAASITDSDPALGRHVEQVAAGWNGIPVARAHLRAQWPSSLSMRLREAGGLPSLRPIDKGGVASIEMSLEDLSPLTPPKGAPLRYQYGRILEMSDAASWSGIVDLMAPLYDKAATLAPTAALQAEITRIQGQTSDPKARAEAALALVQDRVRYVFLGMNDGGLVPADAETTWSRRFGDCKGKTVLLLALLRGMNIDAQPVLVNTAIGDGLDQRLPMVGLFDHVLVRASIAGHIYWLDGTRLGDRGLDGLTIPNFHWGLPLVAGTRVLTPISPPPLTEPELAVTIQIDASKGVTIPAPAHIERLIRGDEAVGLNLALNNMTEDARDQALREYFKQKHDFVTVKTTSTSFDAARRELKLVVDGDARMEWNNGFYEADDVWVGYKADFSRPAGPDQNAPYAVTYPAYVHVSETILLPSQAGAFSIDKSADVDTTVAGVAYHRHADVNADRFTVDETERSVTPEFPAADAPAAEIALRALVKRSVYLKMPAHYRKTKAEVDAAMATTPATADAFVQRGVMLLDRQRFDEALEDFSKALALNPKSALALADRGMARGWKHDAIGAARDFDEAAVLDPHNALVFRGRGFLAGQIANYKEAITNYTKSLEIEPGNEFSLNQRAKAYYALGEYDLAPADGAALVAQNANFVDPYLLRANVFLRTGRRDQASHEADVLVAANSNNQYALVVAGKIYADADRQADAMKAFDRALAIKPDAYIYINRSDSRPKSDYSARLADIDQAFKLEPRSVDVLAAKARVQQDENDWRGAAATLTLAIGLKADDLTLLARRGIAYMRSGQTALGDKDFDAARTLAKTTASLNSLCWMKATAGVALASALTDCDAAIALQPKLASALDSRGLVLVRLGRYHEAVASYSQALSLRPGTSGSLYGRAMAEIRLGEKADADRDRKAAVEVEPGTPKLFEGYGLTFEPQIAPPKG